MKKSKKLFVASTALIPLSMFAAGESYAVTSNIPLAAEVVKAISLTGITSLNFGNILNTATGTVVVNPATGTATPAGVTLAGGTVQAGSAVYNGSDAAITVAVTATTRNVTNGTDTFAVDTYNINTAAGGTSVVIATPGTTTTLLVGGRLNINGIPSVGTYAGTVGLAVDYQ